MALTLLNQRHPLSSAQSQREALNAAKLPMSFEEAIERSPLGSLKAQSIDIFQINVGRKCNQTCGHCHVDAGPDRKEMMSDEVVDAVKKVLSEYKVSLFDITGGAPELHKRFDEMVEHAHALGIRVMDRCNLTILMTKKYQNHHEFFARNKVEIVASLPFHSEKSTDAQRGDGTFEASIAALKKLNSVGYGKEGSGLELTLVANPVGAFLPAPQKNLEADFKRQLKRKFDIDFNQLFSITNMPISRYLEWLKESGNFEQYMTKLANAFNPAAAEGVMCRNTLSVGYEGGLYDCDFNQMLEMPVLSQYPQTIFDFNKAALEHREIAIGPHCFGCTAGQGSSCGGETA